eukprot:jgi/Hompol1/5472/HPOL_001962-RA
MCQTHKSSNAKTVEGADSAVRAGAAAAAAAGAAKTAATAANKGSVRTFRRSEIEQRAAAGEVLIIVHHKVYNLTKWVAYHPGGDLAVRHMAGKDATDAMIAFHPDWVFTERLPRFYIGDLEKEDCITSPVSLAYRNLETKLHEAGLFETDYSFFGRELLKFSILWIGMIYFAVHSSTSNIYFAISILCAATLWQQAAFVAHDTGHSGISHNRTADTLFGITLANFFGGLSMGWWKRNHNTHHIVTNDPEHDPDIQHLPFIAVSPRFMENLFSSYYQCVLQFDAFARTIIPYQHLIFYIVLSFGRFNLYANSWAFALATRHPVPHRMFEIATMLGFWAWFITLLSYLPTWKHVVIYILVSHMATMILHLQITLSHFGMSTVQEKVNVEGVMMDETYAELALRTTMDIACPRWLDWFHGGLQFQIEHHLFPRVPRHNLRKLQPIVKAFAKEHDLPFYEYGFIAGNRYVLGVLQDVANQVSAVIAADAKNIHKH